MKTLRLFFVLAALLFAGVLAPPPASARDSVSFDFFYDSLAPYGEWIEVGNYGLCWRPTNVDPDWTPYSDGYWAFTDGGWTFVSYEDFGGIVYHYGRWLHLDDDSWCWVPDYEWAPAWVSWRYSDDYVGWAPLPPEARWRGDVGISVWVDSAYDIGPGYYHFCHVHDFGAPVLRGVLLPREENVTIIRTTVNVTNITYNTTYAGGPIIFNGGPSFEIINRHSARPIPTLKLVQNRNFDPANWREHRGAGGHGAFNAQTVGNQLIVTAPQVMRPTDPSAFKARIKKVLPAESVTKGWGVGKNSEVQNEWRQEMHRQAKGLTPETAPARKVAAADLKVVPAKADPNAATPAVTSTAESREKPGQGHRPESVVAQPNNPPPNAPVTTPFTATPSAPAGTPTGVVRERGRTKNSPPPTGAPAVGGPNLKPFNPAIEPKGPQNPPTATFTPTPRGGKSAEAVQEGRAAEQARIRAEQERMGQQKQPETAQPDAARARAEQLRQQQLQGQQQQQQQQQQQHKAMDARRVQEAERERQKPEPQREPQTQQRQPPPGNQPPAGSPHPGGRPSKDSKDKDKDKDKNGN